MCSGSEAGSYLRLIDFEERLFKAHRLRERVAGVRNRVCRRPCAVPNVDAQGTPTQSHIDAQGTPTQRHINAQGTPIQSHISPSILVYEDDQRTSSWRPKSCMSTTLRWAWSRYVKRFRGGLVFEADSLVYHSTLGVRVIKKKRRFGSHRRWAWSSTPSRW